VKSSFESLAQQTHRPTLTAEALSAFTNDDASERFDTLDSAHSRGLASAGSAPGDFASRLEEHRIDSPEVLSPLLEQFGKDDSKDDDKNINKDDFPKSDDDGWTFLKHLTISRDQTEGSAFQEEQLAALEFRHNRLIRIEHIGIEQVGVVFPLGTYTITLQ
jgi:hypothetical protein